MMTPGTGSAPGAGDPGGIPIVVANEKPPARFVVDR